MSTLGGFMPMTKDSILKTIRMLFSDFNKRYSVLKIGLFGSFVKGTATNSSDIDILVEFKEPTFDHYMDLKFQLEDKFQRKVDLVTTNSLKKRIRPIVESEVVYA